MTQLITTACPLDCPDACTLEVSVKSGRVTHLTGAKTSVTAGFLCSKVRNFDRHLYHADRIQTPCRRIGSKGDGQFEPISWDEAIDTIAERFQFCSERYGSESILPLYYGGSNGKLSQDTADARLFARLGASRLATTVCAAPSGRAAAGLYGKMPGVAYEEYEQARWVGVWGANPSASGIHLIPWIQRARTAGASLVVVDPVRTPLARQADLHLAPRPGTDLALALALIRWFFENDRADLEFLETHSRGWQELRERAADWDLESAGRVCGLSADQIEVLARTYAEASPAVIRCGWGVERNRNGGSAVAAILALPAVAGKFGVAGGGYTLSNSGAWDFASDKLLGIPESKTRIVNMNQVGRTLLEGDPPVHALFVYNANPLATLPNQSAVERGLRREDLFTVVFDQVWTDTTKYADIVLPATTFLEHRDLARGYGNTVMHRVEPVIEPVGEARSNVRVFGDLIQRLGLSREGEAESPEEIESLVLAGVQGEEDLQGRLDREGDCYPSAGGRPVLFVDRFPGTDDGRIHLVPSSLDEEAGGLYEFRPAPTEDPAFPLTLISPATRRTTSSTFGQLHRKLVPLEINPLDASERDLTDGERVRVSSALGEVICPVKISRNTRPGVVVLPKGLWSHNTINGSTSNAVAPDHLTDLGGGASFNDARVEVAADRKN